MISYKCTYPNYYWVCWIHRTVKLCTTVHVKFKIIKNNKTIKKDHSMLLLTRRGCLSFHSYHEKECCVHLPFIETKGFFKTFLKKEGSTCTLDPPFNIVGPKLSRYFTQILKGTKMSRLMRHSCILYITCIMMKLYWWQLSNLKNQLTTVYRKIFSPPPARNHNRSIAPFALIDSGQI